MNGTLSDTSAQLFCFCQQPKAGRFMIQCDVQGPDHKIWYHSDCVGISKSRGKRMECDNVDFICPLCHVTTVSSEPTQVTIDSHTMSVTDPTHATVPSTAPNVHSEDLFELPSFSEMSPPSFSWNGTIEGSAFVNRVTTAYDEVVRWRRNLFVVPFGNVGKEFMEELARLFHSY